MYKPHNIKGKPPNLTNIYKLKTLRQVRDRVFPSVRPSVRVYHDHGTSAGDIKKCYWAKLSHIV